MAASDAVARFRHVSLLTTHRSQRCRQTRGRRRAHGLSHRSRLRVLRRQEPLRERHRGLRGRLTNHRRRRSTSSACATTTGPTWTSASGDGFGRRRPSKQSSTARRGSTPTAAARRWVAVTLRTGSRPQERMRTTTNGSPRESTFALRDGGARQAPDDGGDGRRRARGMLGSGRDGDVDEMRGRGSGQCRRVVKRCAASTPAVRSPAPTPNANDASPLVVQSADAQTTAMARAPRTTSAVARVSD